MKNKFPVIEEYNLEIHKAKHFHLATRSFAKAFLQFQSNFIQRKELFHISRQLLQVKYKLIF